jgi:hypothetical protein
VSIGHPPAAFVSAMPIGRASATRTDVASRAIRAASFFPHDLTETTMTFRRTASLLLMSTATLALGACGGADDVASPGEGNLIVVNPPAPAPATPTPPPPPPPAPGGAFTGATPAGFTDLGVVNNRRVFGMPSRFTQDTTLQNIPGAVYSIGGPVNVGSDVGGDGNTAGGQAVTLTIQPGTIVVASTGND